nr:MAG TPA: hypothetical protein [Caudoviricetes sp.]
MRRCEASRERKEKIICPYYSSKGVVGMCDVIRLFIKQ